jgi:hypothetical protein
LLIVVVAALVIVVVALQSGSATTKQATPSPTAAGGGFPTPIASRGAPQAVYPQQLAGADGKTITISAAPKRRRFCSASARADRSRASSRPRTIPARWRTWHGSILPAALLLSRRCNPTLS